MPPAIHAFHSVNAHNAETLLDPFSETLGHSCSEAHLETTHPGLGSGNRTLGAGKLEGVQEVVRLLEGGPNCVDLVDEVLNANDPVLAQLSLQTVAALLRAQAMTLLCAKIKEAFKSQANPDGNAQAHMQHQTTVEHTRWLCTHLNDGVLCQRNDVLPHLAVSTLVYELAD